MTIEMRPLGNLFSSVQLCLQVRQIQIEVHFKGMESSEFGDYHDQNELLMKAFADAGYAIFAKEPNTFGCGGDCIEFALINLDLNENGSGDSEAESGGFFKSTGEEWALRKKIHSDQMEKQSVFQQFFMTKPGDPLPEVVQEMIASMENQQQGPVFRKSLMALNQARYRYRTQTGL